MPFPYSSQSHTTVNPSTTDFSYANVLLLADVPHKDQLKVYENGQLRTFSNTGDDNYTLNTTSELVIFNTARASGVTIKIARETDIENKEVTFTNSSVLTAQDLNKNSDQLLFLCQELYDKAQDISLTATGGIPPNSIGEDKLNQSSGTEAVVTTAIRDDAVTTAKIDDEAVTAAKLGASAVETAKIQDGAVTNVKIANTTIEPGKLSTGAPTWTTGGVMSFDSGYGSAAPVYGCRAWGHFIGSSFSSLPYSASNGTVTVTFTGGGMNTGARLNLNFSTALIPNGVYTVTTGGANSFVFSTGGTQTGSGTLTIAGWLVAGGNISYVVRNDVGRYTVTMAEAMPDSFYSMLCLGGGAGTVDILTSQVQERKVARTVSSFLIENTNYLNAPADMYSGNVAVFR